LIIKTGLEVIFEVKLIIVYKIVTALWASPKRKLKRNMWLPKKKAKTTFKSFKYNSLRTDARISSSSSWVNGAISHIFPLRHGGMGAQGRLRYKGDGGSNQA